MKSSVSGWITVFKFSHSCWSGFPSACIASWASLFLSHYSGALPKEESSPVWASQGSFNAHHNTDLQEHLWDGPALGLEHLRSFTATFFPRVVVAWKNSWSQLKQEKGCDNHLGTSEALVQIMTVVLKILPAGDSPVTQPHHTLLPLWLQ